MIANGDEFLEPNLTCGGGSRRNSHACVVKVENGCLGVDPGSKAELARGFAGVGARQCRVAGVEQSFCAGGTMGRRRLELRSSV